ncbi:MAG: lasso peptide biosynthesis B2 protein [Terriglobales bacterium]
MDRLRRFLKYPRSFQFLVAEAFVRLIGITVLLRLLPSSRVCRMWTAPATVPRGRSSASGPAEICHAVKTAANYVPGAHCLPQAVVGRSMLLQAGYPAEIKLGVANPGSGFAAHAWVCSEGEVVLGGSTAEYLELHPQHS